MQARFKFRVWKISENKMIDGVTYFNPFLLDETLAPKEAKNHVIMQCTGLKDKTGKLIYEGDIVKEVCGKHIMLVAYYQETCSFVLKNYSKYAKKRFGKGACEIISLRNLSEDGFKNHQIKIIGNIYENPELLEVENDKNQKDYE